MSVRAVVAVVVLWSMCAVLFAQEADKRKLVETIIQAQKGGEQALKQATGTAVVKRSFKVVERSSQSAANRKKDLREGEETFIVDFKLKGDKQRLSRYWYDAAKEERLDRKDELLSDPETYWIYHVKGDGASHADMTICPYNLKHGDDFRTAAFNSRNGGSFESTLRNGLVSSDHWDASIREDGMMVIRCGLSEVRGQIPKWETEMVLNPAAGYCLVETTTSADWGTGELRKAHYKVDWEQRGDVWYPTKLSSWVDWKRSPGDVPVGNDTEERCEIEIRAFDPAANVPDSAFTVDDMNMPPGAAIVDSVIGLTYKYKAPATHEAALGDVSLDIAAGSSTTVPAASSSPPETGASAPGAQESRSAEGESGKGLSTTVLFALAVAALAVGAVLFITVRFRKGR